MVVDHNDAGMGRPSNTKLGRATEVGRTQEQIYDERQGRWERLGTKHQSGPAAADNGDIGRDDVSGTF